jgi:D-3-phosphoglycerate dehydrogenase
MHYKEEQEMAKKMLVVSEHQENYERFSKGAVYDVFKRTADKYGYDLEVVYDDGLGCEGDGWREAALKVETKGPGWVRHSPEFLKAVEDANIIVVSFSAVGRQLLDAAKNLELVAVMRSGIENIDMEACREKGVPVCNAPGRVSEPVADFTSALILDINRGITYVNKFWKPGMEEELLPYFHPELYKDLTIGMVGFGIIGRKVLHRLKNFGFKFIAYDPYVKQEDVADLGVEIMSLDEVMSKADTVTVHARLLPETKNLIGAHEISLMKESAFLVNTARGGLVDENALIEALKARKIRGAALDVLKTEPLPDDHVLRTLDNVILTPHMAGMAGNMFVVSAEIIMSDVSEFMAGRPLHSQIK